MLYFDKIEEQCFIFTVLYVVRKDWLRQIKQYFIKQYQEISVLQTEVNRVLYNVIGYNKEINYKTNLK